VALLFLHTYEVLAIQARAIEEFGGLHGVRHAGALEAALTAAANRAYYELAFLTMCAATYTYHLTQAHASLDGNKRLGAAVAEIFHELNGPALRTTDEAKERIKGSHHDHHGPTAAPPLDTGRGRDLAGGAR
jgi:death on curing protein